MITLITGLPGNGKTLFALWFIKQKAERENREVFYHNIKDLTLPWTECDPEKWMDLPNGSIVVIDEGQFTFPKKPNGSKLPAHYEQLAVHRHQGKDIFIITQHPTLLDNFVRQLVGQHFHAVRKFGLNRNTVYEWSAANAGPQLAASQKSAVPLKWSFPKEVYGYYKSAEVHTVRRSIPAKLVLACLFVFAVPAAGYYALHRYQQRGQDAPVVSPAVIAEGVPVASIAPGGASPSVRAVFDPVADAKQFVAMNTPRVVGLPQTAPKYDELTKPVRVPVPAACVQIGSARESKQIRCKCYTQQGTPMDVEFNMCISFAQNGWFRDFEADPNKQQQASVQAVSEPASKVEPSGPSVIAFADVPPPVRASAAPPPSDESGDGAPKRTVYKAVQ